jgi:hypothetical protein
MCCGISKLKLHLQSEMEHINLLLDVLNEGFYSAIILNFLKPSAALVFWHIPNTLVTFKDIKVLFVNYIINALPVDFRSFINKTNIVADFFLNNVTVIEWAATCRECNSQEIYIECWKEAWEN